MLKLNDEPEEVQAPEAIQKVLEVFKDFIPVELSKTFPPRRKLDHAIELGLGRHLYTKHSKCCIQDILPNFLACPLSLLNFLLCVSMLT